MDTASIDSRTLYSLLGSHDAPIVVDVRRAPAFEADPRLIPSALRPDGDVTGFVAKLDGNRRVVAYCVHGHEVSQNAARALAQAGREASFLEGGIEAWIALGLPTVRAQAEGNTERHSWNPQA